MRPAGISHFKRENGAINDFKLIASLLVSSKRIMELGTLSKMTLQGFEDVDFSRPTGNFYTAAINPESYTLNYEILLSKEQPAKEAPEQTYISTAPQKMEFEFIFDSTGALQAHDIALPFNVGNTYGIWAQLMHFKKTVYDFIGDTHQTPFVKLKWGDLELKCKLEKMQVICKLFKPDGSPIRAVVKASFIEQIKKELLKPTSSPDLTHIRTVNAGDTLPLMCHYIYGDSTLYREVARVNNLLQFRRLIVGQQLVFPPLEKKN